MSEILTIENLTISFNQFDIIKNISFSVFKGDYVNIIGPNGAGKTTLIKAILGLIPEYRGNIKYHEDRIGYLPQKTYSTEKIFPATVKEIVSLGLLATKKHPKIITVSDQKQIMNTLNKLHIANLANRRIGLLSGGQQQRVLLARAIVNTPSMLILDEPTSALDPKFKKEFYKLLKKLNQEYQMTILHITHDISGLEDSGNKVLYINQEVVYYGKRENFTISNHL